MDAMSFCRSVSSGIADPSAPPRTPQLCGRVQRPAPAAPSGTLPCACAGLAGRWRSPLTQAPQALRLRIRGFFRGSCRRGGAEASRQSGRQAETAPRIGASRTATPYWEAQRAPERQQTPRQLGQITTAAHSEHFRDGRRGGGRTLSERSATRPVAVGPTVCAPFCLHAVDFFRAPLGKSLSQVKSLG